MKKIVLKNECVLCGDPLPMVRVTEKTLTRTIEHSVVPENQIARLNGRRVHKACLAEDAFDRI